MRRLTVVLGVLILAVLVVAVTVERPGSDPGPQRSAGPSPRLAGSPPRPADGPLLTVERPSAAARPTEVRVPRLDITSRLDRIGVDAGRALETPPRWQSAAWFTGGPRPGETGPAVIAGHLDSPTGPAVFSALPGVRSGDLVQVDDARGVTRTFRVDRIGQSPRRSFPSDAVYGPTPDAQLRLITCSGRYRADAGGYQDNLVVYATQVTR